MTEEEFRLSVVKGLASLKATVETEVGHIKDDVSEIKADMKDFRGDIQEVRDIAKAPRPPIPCKEKTDCHMEAVEATVHWNRKLVYLLMGLVLTVAGKIVWSSYDTHKMDARAAKVPVSVEKKVIN